MGDPFVGFARPPEGAPTQADVDAAISAAAVRYNVPASTLSYVQHQESGGEINAAQVVGYNSAGYGGLFGLPRSLLGTIGEQADAAARILAEAFRSTGSWEGALRRYSGGAYGAPTVSSPPDGRPKQPEQPKPGQAGGGARSPADIIVSQRPTPGTLPGETPGASAIGKSATTREGGSGGPLIGITVPGFEQVGQFFADLTSPKTWIRIGFIIAGVGFIIVGVILYTKPDIALEDAIRRSGGIHVG